MAAYRQGVRAPGAGRGVRKETSLPPIVIE
jgi:hypothetical protein